MHPVFYTWVQIKVRYIFKGDCRWVAHRYYSSVVNVAVRWKCHGGIYQHRTFQFPQLHTIDFSTVERFNCLLAACRQFLVFRTHLQGVRNDQPLFLVATWAVWVVPQMPEGSVIHLFWRKLTGHSPCWCALWPAVHGGGPCPRETLWANSPVGRLLVSIAATNSPPHS